MGYFCNSVNISYALLLAMLSRRELFRKTATIAKGAALTGLAGVVASCSDSGAKEPVDIEPTFDVEVDGLVGKFYIGNSNTRLPDRLDIYKDGQLLYRISDSNGNAVIGDGVGFTRELDKFEVFENGKLIARYDTSSIWERGLTDVISQYRTVAEQALNAKRIGKLAEATNLYQNFLKTGLRS